MFSDADLFGIPLRVVVSPKGLKNGTIEISSRDKKLAEKLPEEAISFISERVQSELAACAGCGRLSLHPIAAAQG